MSRRGSSCCFCVSSSLRSPFGAGTSATADPTGQVNANPHVAPPSSMCGRPNSGCRLAGCRPPAVRGDHAASLFYVPLTSRRGWPGDAKRRTAGCTSSGGEKGRSSVSGSTCPLGGPHQRPYAIAERPELGHQRDQVTAAQLVEGQRGAARSCGARRWYFCRGPPTGTGCQGSGPVPSSGRRCSCPGRPQCSDGSWGFG